MSGLTNLTELNLRDNQIADVSPLVSLTSLTTLNLTDNTGITNAAVLYSLQQGGTTITGVTVPASVTIPDAALATVIRNALSLTVDAPIPSDRLAALTRLTASNQGIADLTGLENAVSLTSLTLSNNQIIDVSPLADLTNLRTLNLTGNPISNPEVLISLQQSGTRIIGITVPHEVIFPDAGLEAVVRTALSLGNGVPILSNKLATLTEKLDASNRSITDLTGLEEATGLTELDLRVNLISDVSPLANLTNLAELHLDNNPPLSDVSPLSKLTNLTQLGLSFTLVSDVSPLSKLTNLTQLGLSFTLVSDVSPLSKLTNLTELYLSSNPLLSDISALSNLTNLERTDLRKNAITDVSPLAGLTRLKWLYLLDNPVANPGALAMLKARGTTLIDIYVPTAMAIPDTALAAAVRAALDLAADAPIPAGTLASLKTLEAPSLGITQLTGLMLPLG